MLLLLGQGYKVYAYHICIYKRTIETTDLDFKVLACYQMTVFTEGHGPCEHPSCNMVAMCSLFVCPLNWERSKEIDISRCIRRVLLHRPVQTVEFPI